MPIRKWHELAADAAIASTEPDMTALPESNHHLGYPLEGVMPAWGITVHMKDKMVPVAFSKAQALEIARRISKYYKTD